MNQNMADGSQLAVHSYEQALIVPRQGKRYRRHEVGLFADGRQVPWSNADVSLPPSPQPEAREPVVEARYVDRDVVFIGTLWCLWGHLITDFVRHLWPLLSLDRGLQVVYAVGSPKQRLPENFRQFLEAIGVSSDRLVEIREPTRFRRVYFGEPSYWHDSEDRILWTPEHVAVVDAVVRNLVGEAVPRQPGLKVYLTRTGLAKGRKDFGEKIIEQAYRRKGFRIVMPERLSLSELVRLLAGAEVIAATEGSVSHNALFAPKGACLEILRKCEWVNSYQETINQMRELKVSVYNVSVASMLAVPAKPWRGPFLIGVTPELAAHLGCEPKQDFMERLLCRICQVKMWIRAHRI